MFEGPNCVATRVLVSRSIPSRQLERYLGGCHVLEAEARSNPLQSVAGSTRLAVQSAAIRKLLCHLQPVSHTVSRVYGSSEPLHSCCKSINTLLCVRKREWEIFLCCRERAMHQRDSKESSSNRLDRAFHWYDESRRRHT